MGGEIVDIIIQIIVNEGEPIEWVYDIDTQAITIWEQVDRDDPFLGKKLMRYFIFSQLKENCAITYTLLTNNCNPLIFMEEGVAAELAEEIPRLDILNTVIDKVYTCMDELACDMDIRKVH